MPDRFVCGRPAGGATVFVNCHGKTERRAGRAVTGCPGRSRMTPVLEVSHVSYTYHPGSPDEVNALRDVSFSVYPGERIALLGANGCGKTTLFSCIDALLVPQSGQICVDGRRIGKKRCDITFARERIGYIFQDPDRSILCADLHEELSFGCLNGGMSPERTRETIRSVIRRLDMEALRDRPTYDLSGGQKKWVSIAAVIAMEPKLILMDEPEAGLDPRHRARLISLLGQLCEEGKALVISTHDMEFALEWADRWIIMRDGRIERDGPALETAFSYPFDAQTGLKPPTVVSDVRSMRETGVLDPNEGEVGSRAELLRVLADKYGSRNDKKR